MGICNHVGSYAWYFNCDRAIQGKVMTNKSNDLTTVLTHLFLAGTVDDSQMEAVAEAKAAILELALSCLPEKVDVSDFPEFVTVEWVRQHPTETEKLCRANGWNDSIDQTAANLKRAMK